MPMRMRLLVISLVSLVAPRSCRPSAHPGRSTPSRSASAQWVADARLYGRRVRTTCGQQTSTHAGKRSEDHATAQKEPENGACVPSRRQGGRLPSEILFQRQPHRNQEAWDRGEDHDREEVSIANQIL